jgi:hypothetical protein
MEIPKLCKCYLCGRWLNQRAMFQIQVEDQGGGWIQKLACEACLQVAGNIDRVPFEDQRERLKLG